MKFNKTELILIEKIIFILTKADKDFQSEIKKHDFNLDIPQDELPCSMEYGRRSEQASLLKEILKESTGAAFTIGYDFDNEINVLKLNEKTFEL